MFDRKCDICGQIVMDMLEKINTVDPPCRNSACGGLLKRAWLPGQANNVIADGVPGGFEVKNALCHADGTPRRFDSKSEMTKYAKEHGWTNKVEHLGTKGGDRSKHTSRWV